MTSSNGNIFRVAGSLCVEFTGYRWIPYTKASDAELSCFIWSAPWIKFGVNNREAGDLWHHHAHYDVIVSVIHTVVHRFDYISCVCGVVVKQVLYVIVCFVLNCDQILFSQLYWKLFVVLKTFQWYVLSFFLPESINRHSKDWLHRLRRSLDTGGSLILIKSQWYHMSVKEPEIIGNANVSLTAATSGWQQR